MLRQFSSHPDQNPGDWMGENWESRGYNVYAFFPEFPEGFGKGVGDFEVDYQDTSADFWRITGELQPVAIITFGRDEDDTFDWEVESRHRNRSLWWFDYQVPLLPTPSPPDDTVPAGHVRYSSLPMQDIVDAVASAGLGVTAFVSTDCAGAFLCEYVGYHATWYHDLHADWSDPGWNVAAGHIHVGGLVGLADAIAATEVTLRVLTAHLDLYLWAPADFDRDRDVDQDDREAFETCVSGPALPLASGCQEKDFDTDGDVDQADFGVFQRCISGENNPADPNCAG